MTNFIREDLQACVILTFPKEKAPHDLFKELQLELEKLIPTYTGKAIIVDFDGLPNIGTELARAAALGGRAAKRLNIRLHFAGLAPAGVKFLKANGLEDSVILSKNRETAIQEELTGANKSGFDEAFVNSFVGCALETLKVQCHFEATAGAPVFQKKAESAVVANIVAQIGMISRAFNGTITLCLPDKVFLGMMSGMLGKAQMTIHSDIEDGAGELLTIIFGQAKTKLSSAGYSIEKALATVIRGQQLKLKHLGDTFRVPFSSANGDFELQIAGNLGSSK